MVFTMPALAKCNDIHPHWIPSWIPTWIPGAMGSLCLMFAAALPAHADNAFVIQSATTVERNNVYHINARIKYSFSDEALAALKNGVPLIIQTRIKVFQERDWLWNKEIASLQQGYLLIYHALSEKFIIHKLNSGTQENFSTLQAALNALGRIDNLPILDANLLAADEKYTVQMHTLLDIEALPAPMRPLAYISTEWQLQSDLHTWPLVH